MGATTIAFEQLPASIRKPTMAIEFNTKTAVRSLPTNAQKLVLIGAMAATGTAATAYQVYEIFDDVAAAYYFGKGSNLYNAALAAMRANPYVRLSCVALPATGAVLQTALTAVFGADYNIYSIDSNTQADLTILRNHLEAISHPLEQRPAIGVSAFTGTVSAGTALAAALNSGRITIGWLKNSAMAPRDIAAAYAAVIAAEEDPARPLNTLWLNGVDVNAIIDRPGRTEQEVALAGGLTPLEVGPGERVQIVRAITTYTKNAAGANDVSLLDVTTIRSLDYLRKAVVERWKLRFPRDKKTVRTKDAVRSEALDVLYKCEELEIVEAVEENKTKLVVQDNLQDVSRLDVRIPADVVNGLHVIGGVIDMYL